MAEEPRTPTCEHGLTVFAEHTTKFWEPEFASYLYWKFLRISASHNASMLAKLKKAYTDYKRERGGSRCISYRKISPVEFAYIHNRRLELQNIHPKQRRSVTLLLEASEKSATKFANSE